MNTLLAKGSTRFLGLSTRQWIAAFALFIAYLATMLFSNLLVPSMATLFPASGIALASLFLGGLELWPVVFLASLLGNVLVGSPLLGIIVMPIAQTLQAVAGASLLRGLKIDPLFRRSRDMFGLFVTVLLAGLIVPSVGSITTLANTAFFEGLPASVSWGEWYTATIFCLLLVVPFMMRWFAKPRFSRTWPEAVETLAVFALLVGIDWALFLGGVPSIGGISLVYFLLIPLFWIALRLRPRFVTLALLITAAFALKSVLGTPGLDAQAFNQQLFQIETFLIVLASIFFVIVSQEEDRRLHTNLMRSQVSTLENAVMRISNESKAKNDFIAVLAHELRNPLAPVVSAIEFMKLKFKESSEDQETLTMMEDRMQTVKRLLDDLLDISRISEGKVDLKLERVDIETVLKHAILSTEHYRQDRHQSLSWKASKKPVMVEGDSVRLEQVFSNLLTNASKYSDSGDTITLSVEGKGSEVEVTVADQGVGIDSSSFDAIFTPFYQIDKSERARKGLGIGLALVRSFVELHGGTVRAMSEGQDRGSRFIVSLPRVEAPAASSTKKVSEPRPKAKRTNANGPSVLVVDDNDAAAWGIGKLLELSGCFVRYAYDGAQAIEAVASEAPDIVLLDVGLPDQDGYTVARTMRARGYTGRLIALTGFSTDDARDKGRSAGFEQYLVKPAGLAELKAVIPEIA